MHSRLGEIFKTILRKVFSVFLAGFFPFLGYGGVKLGKISV
jgi:hypothetical protein